MTVAAKVYRRTPVVEAKGYEARARFRAMQTARSHERQARQEADDHAAWLRARYIAELERFDMRFPFDPFALDTLAQVEIGDDGRWRWLGGTNNKGIAVVRMPRDAIVPSGSERSAVRYLAVLFGIIGPNDHGLLYPTDGPDNVDPRRRVLRRTDKSVGNPTRFDSEEA